MTVCFNHNTFTCVHEYMLHKQHLSSIPLINDIQGLRIEFMLWLRDVNKYNIPVNFDVLQLITFAQNFIILTLTEIDNGYLPNSP